MAFFNGYLNIIGSTALLALAFYLLELWIPAEAGQTLVHRLGNWLYTPFVVLWVLTLQIILTPLYVRVLAIAEGGMPARLREILPAAAADILTGILFAVLWDVWQYWVHRWQHSSALLWETHRFHHSDGHLNASSQARHHATSYVVYLVSYLPMLLLFGAFAPHAIVSILMFRLWGFVNHANVRIGFGPLTMMIAGPQWHRIHHSTERRHYDTNFAALFPFIDRLFGTYYKPLPDEYPPTGLPDEKQSELRQATIAPFVSWADALSLAARRARKRLTAG